MDYRVWTVGTAYRAPTPDVLASLDAYLAACRARGIHLSINVHRAPGYCITGQELEVHDLWHDERRAGGLRARSGRRSPGTSSASRRTRCRSTCSTSHRSSACAGSRASSTRTSCAARSTAVRGIDPDRPIVIDGLDGGNLAMPELGDLGLVHSGRGYAPYPVSHWGADWWQGWREGDAPRWPGVVYQGRAWDRDDLRAFYEPWRAVERAGTPIHIGEFGCYNRTPNEDALRWFGDLLELFREFGWGFALWQFEGPFGIVGHGREGARFESRDGYLVDVELLDLLLGARSVRP